MVDIEQLLPQDIFDALENANAPTAINPFATIADLASVNENMAITDLVLDDDRFHDGDGYNWQFVNTEEFEIESNDTMRLGSLNSSVTIDAATEVEINSDTFDLNATGLATLNGDAIVLTATAGLSLIHNGGSANLGITQTGTGNLNLTTAGGAGSGQINLNSGTGDINITAGTGRVIIEGLTYPNVDGTPNQVLETNGGGVLSWVTPSSGNTLYSADDTIGAGRVATLTDSLTFEDGHVIIDGGAGTGFLTTVKRDFAAGVGGRGTSQTINSYGSDVRTVRTNGTALQIWNEWTIGSSRKSFDFIASVNNNYFSIFQSTNGTTENVRIGEIGSWWNPRNTTAFGFGFGHTSPLAGTVHVDNMDFRVEGAGSTLLFADYSSNGVGIGTTNPTGYRLLVKGGDVAWEGASLNNEFFFDYSANRTIIGASSGLGKFHVQGGDSYFSTDISHHALKIQASGGRHILSSTNVANTTTWLQLANDLTSYLNLPSTLGFHIGSTTGVGVTAKLTSKGFTATAAMALQNAGATSTSVLEDVNGRSGFGITGAGVLSKVTIAGDAEIVGGAFGVIFEDRTTGQRTRWFVDNGTFQQENV